MARLVVRVLKGARLENWRYRHLGKMVKLKGVETHSR